MCCGVGLVDERLVRVIRYEPVGEPGERIERLLLAQVRERLEHDHLELVVDVVLRLLARRHGLDDAVAEEEAYLALGTARRVAAVHGVALLVGAVASAQALDVELARLDRVRRSDEVAPGGDGVLARQLHGDDGAAAHERHQTRKEDLARVVAVELAALLGAQMDLALLQNGEAGAQYDVLDLFGLVDRIGLDYGERALDQYRLASATLGHYFSCC